MWGEYEVDFEYLHMLVRYVLQHFQYYQTIWIGLQVQLLRSPMSWLSHVDCTVSMNEIESTP
jgi:hypothetical protein